ncbi:MAG: hypothetical protein DKM50_08560 [Candidatus Margulisiibacteriota bacterium]|nr:MAG: hypothetical protein DKM50_08560 [Candidatus Margulisiibacteriota bacterium]HCY37825.1 hypothetical protein [Candidatus Margulisiibacteriota bacterium]
MSEPVVLVYPYFYDKTHDSHLFFPLGIAAISSQIQEKGLAVHICDCTFKDFGLSLQEIISYRPGIVGIYVMVTLSNDAFRLARELKKHLPESLLVAGGPLPTIYPERFLSVFDVVFRGECDYTFARFCSEYFKSSRNFLGTKCVHYPGLFFLNKGLIISNPVTHYNAEMIDRLPLPDRSGFDHKLYQDISEKKTGYKPASIMITKGCPYHCDFCSKPIFGNVFRKRAIANVLDEIIDIKRWGYNQLWIADDSFTLDLQYLQAFCSALISRKLDITWTCLTRVNGLTSTIVNLMRQAGCLKVYLGLESGSNETLQVMNKGVTVEDGTRAIRLFQKSGIKTSAFFIVGYPGESIESIEKTFDFSLAFPFEEISFNVPLPLPGSPIFERIKGINCYEDWNYKNELRFIYPTEIDGHWIKRRVSETMSEFSCRKAESIP